MTEKEGEPYSSGFGTFKARTEETGIGDLGEDLLVQSCQGATEVDGINVWRRSVMCYRVHHSCLCSLMTERLFDDNAM